jgi:hypothetical protein
LFKALTSDKSISAPGLSAFGAALRVMLKLKVIAYHLPPGIAPDVAMVQGLSTVRRNE